MERRIDELGRLCIPAEYRKSLGWGKGARLNMNIDGERVIITKSEMCCTFCGATKNLKDVKGMRVCQHCINEIKDGVFFDVEFDEGDEE